MRTKQVIEPSIAVFLFAHQDDECGVYEQIYRMQQQGIRPVCLYATTGVRSGHNCEQRNRESLSVLQSLGVARQDIIFVGEQLAVPDGSLIEHLCRLSEWLDHWLAQQTNVACIFVPAWEGGHPDHDGLHAVAVQISHEAGLLGCLHQFSLYNGYHCVAPFFRLFYALQDNGVTQYHRIPWHRRWRYLCCVASYPSQWRTWVGLFPFFLMHQIFWGYEAFQPVCLTRLQERPHSGDLYYEMRGFSTWEHMQRTLRQWIATRPRKQEE